MMENEWREFRDEMRKFIKATDIRLKQNEADNKKVKDCIFDENGILQTVIKIREVEEARAVFKNAVTSAIIYVVFTALLAGIVYLIKYSK